VVFIGRSFFGVNCFSTEHQKKWVPAPDQTDTTLLEIAHCDTGFVEISWLQL